MLRTILHTVSRILFPDFCVGCGVYKAVCCNDCWNRARGAGATESSHIFASVSYQSRLVKSCIKTIKVREQLDLVQTMVQRMVNDSSEFLYEYRETHSVTRFLVIAVPLSCSRLRERGFNQSQLIAESFVHYAPVPCILAVNTTTRRDTGRNKQSTAHSRGERFASLRDAFSVNNPEQIRNIDILLIDDVTTTGATLLELRTTLLNAGARSVVCIGLAH